MGEPLFLVPMIFRRIVLCAALAGGLPAASAEPASATPAAATPPAPLRLHLRVVDACPLADVGAAAACGTVHRRSDANAPAPPQVQALTPPSEGGTTTARAWQTITF